MNKLKQLFLTIPNEDISGEVCSFLMVRFTFDFKYVLSLAIVRAGNLTLYFCSF